MTAGIRSPIYPVTKIPRKRWKGIIDRVSGELCVTPGEVYAVLTGSRSGRHYEHILDHIERYMRDQQIYDDSCSTFTFCLEDARRKSNMQNYVEPSAEQMSLTFMDRMYKALARRDKETKVEARRIFTNPVKVDSGKKGGNVR